MTGPKVNPSTMDVVVPHSQYIEIYRTYIAHLHDSNILTPTYICKYIHIYSYNCMFHHNPSWPVRHGSRSMVGFIDHLLEINRPPIEQISSIYRRRESRSDLGLLTSSSARLSNTRSISVSRRGSRSGISLPPTSHIKINQIVRACIYIE